MPTSNPLQRTRRPPQESIRLAPLGDSAITVEFGDEIDPRVNACVVAFTNTIADQGWKGILDIVPTYRSVTIYFDALQWTFPDLAQRLRRVPRPSSDAIRSGGRLHKIPVLYGGEWGPDLEDLAAFAGLSPTETITLHTSVRYQVYMLGFSPGFAYLGFVREQLAMPRLSTPRTKVPASSVGIADRQTVDHIGQYRVRSSCWKSRPHTQDSEAGGTTWDSDRRTPGISSCRGFWSSRSPDLPGRGCISRSYTIEDSGRGAGIGSSDAQPRETSRAR